MPPNTVCVDRSTPWGNPFVVGRDGTRAECVDLYAKLLCGSLTDGPSVDHQLEVRRYVSDNLTKLRGKNLACWCGDDGELCHADVLLEIANNA